MASVHDTPAACNLAGPLLPHGHAMWLGGRYRCVSEAGTHTPPRAGRLYGEGRVKDRASGVVEERERLKGYACARASGEERYEGAGEKLPRRLPIES